MVGVPESGEAAPYFSTYIGRIASPDILGVLRAQANEAERLLGGVTEDGSRFAYAEGKWSIRQVVNHVSDTERIFAFRALWFARGLEGALLSFDQDVAAAGAGAEAIPLAAHREEFRAVRQATVALFANLPAEAWMRRGEAIGHSFTVRALAYMIAGHFDYHAAILRERYKLSSS